MWLQDGWIICPKSLSKEIPLSQFYCIQKAKLYSSMSSTWNTITASYFMPVFISPCRLPFSGTTASRTHLFLKRFLKFMGNDVWVFIRIEEKGTHSLKFRTVCQLGKGTCTVNTNVQVFISSNFEVACFPLA